MLSVLIIIVLIKQVTLNKWSLLLRNILQNTQTLHKIKVKIIYKVFKMPSEEAWVWIDQESN
jgi:hypothetical protein